MSILETINDSGDIKKLSIAQIDELCSEIREFLIENISKTGGHLAPNLGIVETTVALFNVFDFKHDDIVWDVGHQSYVYKMLTGRMNKFGTLRQRGGISGFPSPKESEYDSFVSGHSSTSVSAALGILEAKRIKGDNSETVAVIGDGALTGGLAYEGLNNAGRSKQNLIVILNDNEMSISKNVGGVARHLANIRNTPKYFAFKDLTFGFLMKIPLIGRPLFRLIFRVKKMLKDMLYNATFFEDLGFAYLGPVDGHDVKTLSKVLKRAKQLKKPALVHVHTTKGKGYAYAEENPDSYHGIAPFDVALGYNGKSDENFSAKAGEILCKIAGADETVCAVTAAMTEGTGLTRFAQKYKNRFFDVGIAEGHAVTFCAGLASKGLKPVFFVYSSFLQRAYDQLVHDIAICSYKIVICIDRAGIVGEDGETHQGILDAAFLNTVPNLAVFCPVNYAELEEVMNKAIYDTDTPCCIRYPRGGQAKYYGTGFEPYTVINNSSDSVIVTYGRLIDNVITANEKLKMDIIKVGVLKPFDDSLVEILNGYKRVFFIEEGMENGSALQSLRASVGTKTFHKGIPGRFVPHGKVEILLEELGLDAGSIYKYIEGNIDG